MPEQRPPEQEPADKPEADFIEVDPTGRYGRYEDVLGKGAFKTVYKAFDELEGIEVAWNQVKVMDVVRHCDDLERLYSEVHLLQTLKHKHIIKFYNSWVDTKHDNINFITEVFTSGTLRQYRKKHKHVDLRALKNWSRQILSGLLYLHSHDPPVIHRDLKCDNIFINGNQGEVKIGDLGLAAILRHAHSAHSVIGTPEFMAPELYEEEYNELVDIYAFGMCLLELVTFEYPYVECTNAAQIYKKVTSGVKPASLSKVKEPGVKRFIEKCIANVPERLSARELLVDPFLQSGVDDNKGHSSRPDLMQPDHVGYPDAIIRTNADEAELPSGLGRDFRVEGQRKDINTIFLKLRIEDSAGQIRNIHFPFDIEADTAISVATEMVAELDLTDQDVTAIAAMIDTEIQVHFPEWVGEGVDDNDDSDMVGSEGHGSEAEDKVHALPDEVNYSPNRLVLERLPSGRRYWSNSPPKGSPSGHNQLIQSPDVNSHASDALSAEVYEMLGSPQSLPEQNINALHRESPTPPRNNSAHQGVTSSASLGSADPGSKTGDSSCNRSQDNAYTGKHEKEHQSPDETSTTSEPEVEFMVQELEKLFNLQQYEIEELKKKHCLAIAQLLQKVPPDVRVRIFYTCRSKFPDYNIVKNAGE